MLASVCTAGVKIILKLLQYHFGFSQTATSSMLKLASKNKMMTHEDAFIMVLIFLII
jgi:hypothetical protein